MRFLKISVIALAIAVTAAAFAHGGRHHGFFRRHVNSRIDGALDAAKANPQQRATIEKARDRVYAAVEKSHEGRRQHMQKVMALFESDKIDPAQVKALRDEHEASSRTGADALLNAITEAHATLQPAQRKAVADYVRGKMPQHPPRAVGDWFKKRAFSHVDDALDEVKASDEQRKAVEAAVEQVFNAFRAEHEAAPGHIDQAIALFEADRIDTQKVAALRAEHDARRQKLSEAIAQAFHDVHDTLTSAQRKQLVAWVRANHGHM